MDSYSIKQTSFTASHVVVYGILATQLLSGEIAAAEYESEQRRLLQSPYETYANLPSFDQISSIAPGNFAEGIDHQFVSAVSTFYAQLLDNQEVLGKEFEQVLNENLWNLYER